MAANDDGKLYGIEINGRKVKMPGGPATGREIKDAAIKDGVAIQPNFVLQSGTAQRYEQGDR